MIRRIVGTSMLAAMMVLVLWSAVSGDTETAVAPGRSVERAIAEGGSVRLLPGSHRPFEVTEMGATVIGMPGSVVRGPVVVAADGVELHDVHVTGGESGVSVVGAQGVVLDDVTVEGARLHGIEVEDGQATIRGCAIGGMESPYAQGIEIRNASTRPRSVVAGCVVRGGQEGVITHSARIELLDNRITETTLRGLAITEMSEGVMEGNLVHSVVGSALYCGDMSHCEIRANTVRDVASEPGGGPSMAGYGVVGWYHSTVRVHGNVLDVPRDRRVRLGSGTVATDRFPPSIWAPGWRGLLPGIWVSGLGLAALGAVRLAVTPWLRRRREGSVDRAPDGDARTMLLLGFAAQSFHMLEHVVQVVQVYVFDGERRSGLLGSAVDTESVHFIYNVAVLAFMVWVWRRLRPRMGSPSAGERRWLPWFFAATVIQAYHLLEHGVKMYQHLAIGLDPAPGLVGGRLGLVWFHFGINLAVYAGLAALALGMLRGSSPAPRGVSVAPAPEPT